MKRFKLGNKFLKTKPITDRKNYNVYNYKLFISHFYLKIPSLINNSGVYSNAVSNSLSIATKLYDQHPSIINIKNKKFDSVLNFKKLAVLKYKKLLTI